jgi:hypothetical protein
VRELLRAGGEVRRVLVAVGRDHSEVLDEALALAAQRRIPVDEVARDELEALTDGLVHQGVVALAPPYRYASLDAVLERAATAGEAPLLVALDGVTDPHNLGSIARTAEAVGAHGLIVPGRRAAGVTPSAEKAAAGALAHLPVVEVTNLVRALGELSDAGVWSLGLDGDAEVMLAEHPLACVGGVRPGRRSGRAGAGPADPRAVRRARQAADARTRRLAQRIRCRGRRALRTAAPTRHRLTAGGRDRRGLGADPGRIRRGSARGASGRLPAG